VMTAMPTEPQPAAGRRAVRSRPHGPSNAVRDPDGSPSRPIVLMRVLEHTYERMAIVAILQLSLFG
jgi:hypothetical protein